MKHAPINVSLNDADLIAEGGERWVYGHPDFSDLVFKLQKPVSQRDLKMNTKGLSIRMFPTLRNRIVKKEYKAFIDCCIEGTEPLEDVPVSQLYGFAQSNRGIVQVAEKVSLDRQTHGPTLLKLAREGQVNPELCAMLTNFVQQLLRWNIPTNDLSARNIVLGSRNGRQRFLSVDGFGDIQVFPIRTYFRFVQRRALMKRMAKVAAGIGVQCDGKAFTFSMLA